jgi:GNAT superfamily N-acetyltransferase
MKWENFDSDNGFGAALNDGELIHFRPVRPDDWTLIQGGMSELSPQSRYLRFFSSLSKLSDTQLHYFSEVDQHDHVAWIALAGKREEHPAVGIARFIRLQDQPTIAEFAVTVIDRYQHRGLGSILLAVLYLMASSKGLERLRGLVLPENRLMLNWLSRLGAVGKYENEVCRMDISIDRDLSFASDLPLLKHFRDCMDKASR